jgi:hypothetical protein
MSDHPTHSTGAKREKLAALRYDLMPSLVVNEAYARVSEFGAKKYDFDNWRKGLPSVQISGSLQRHLWAWLEGQDKDPESGLSHLDHILWNAVALCFNEANDICDDRIPTRINKVTVETE